MWTNASKGQWWIALLLLCAACERSLIDTREELFPFEGSRLVLYSFLSDDAPFLDVELLKTLPPLAVPDTLPLVRDAEVVLYENDLPIDTLEFVTAQAVYRSTFAAPREGNRYHLRARVTAYPEIQTDPVVIPQPATGVLDSVVIDARGDHLLYLRWTGTTAPYGYTRRTLLYSGEQLIETAETGLPVNNPVSAQELTATSYPPLRLRPQRVIFGTDPPIPIDTIEATSAAVVFYTWGPELLHHFNAQLAASGGIGDGTYAVENVIYTNVAGGYGLFVGYATDTLYYTF